jgi:tetratricopeptide (TPR) repeat protein
MKFIKSVLIVLAFFAIQIPVNSQNKEGLVAFKNVNLITMTSDKVMPDRTVIVNGNKIYKIGSSREVSIPEGAVIIDGTGKYLMPGLADMHVHFGERDWETPDANLFLANGVTTVRDLSQGSFNSIKKWCEEFNSKKRLGPAIYNARTIWGWENNLLKITQSARENNYDCIKINSYLTKNAFYEIINDSKKLGIYTIGHIPYTINVSDVAASGMNELSHIEVIVESLLFGPHFEAISSNNFEKWDEEMKSSALALFEDVHNDKSGTGLNKIKARLSEEVSKLKGKDFTVTSTIAVEQSISWEFNDPQKISESPGSKYISGKYLDDLKNGVVKNSFYKGKEWAARLFYDLVLYTASEIRKNKIRIVAGTDSGPNFLGIVPGFSLIDELKLLVESGYSYYEALSSSTREASKIIEKMTGLDEFGTVEAGKRADFILLQNNPLDNIDNLRNPLGVMTAGVWLDKKELERLLDVKKKSVVPVLRDAWKNYNNVDSLVSVYKKLRDQNKYNEYYITANSLTSIGYDLKKLGRNDDALVIFKLNAEEYPNNANSFDCLGEIYLEIGDKQKAIDNYEQALKMDPSFDSSIKALKELGR